MHTSILLTGAGGPAAISFFKAMAGKPIVTHMADMDPNAAGLYLVPSERRALVPRGDAPEFVNAILELCLRMRIDVLVPTVDAELLPIARNRARFAEAGVKVLLAPLAGLELCLDKWLLHTALSGIAPLPKTRLASDRAALEPGDFPLILKPRKGSGSRGIQLIKSLDDMPKLADPSQWLVQEYLPGEEYSVDVLASAIGRVVAAVPRVRLKVDSGIAVTGRTLHDLTLESVARSVVAHLGLPFIANVQLRRRANGEPVLLEVNPRAPGTMPLTVAAGVNMPWLALSSLLGHDITHDGEFNDLAVVRYWQEQFMPVEELAELSSAPHEPAVAAE